MSYQLVVSEKPSVGAAYAKVLGATNRQDGYWEGNGYLVSWCVGHLVELAPPNIYDAKYVKWSIADLPILPQKWQYLVSASTKKQFVILQKLMHRPDVDSIVNSCDSGRAVHQLLQDAKLFFRAGRHQILPLLRQDGQVCNAPLDVLGIVDVGRCQLH